MTTTNTMNQAQDSGTCCQESRDRVARQAYAAFERNGSAHGQDLQDWLAAEAHVKAADASAKHAQHQHHHAHSASTR